MLTFIETRLFTRLVQEYLSDEEYAAVQAQLIRDPEAGAVIRDTGGVRKIRVAARGRGKSGGFRIIYYLSHPKGVVWMLTIYPKSETDTIPAHVLRQIREEIEGG
jgi:mRNA-degrading endonuclease RelE of RelBE toxin-antitoxin system